MTFNPGSYNDIDPSQAPSIRLPKEGWQTARIEKVKYGTTSTGKRKLDISFRIDAGEDAGLTIEHTLWFSNLNEFAAIIQAADAEPWEERTYDSEADFADEFKKCVLGQRLDVSCRDKYSLKMVLEDGKEKIIWDAKKVEFDEFEPDEGEWKYAASVADRMPDNSHYRPKSQEAELQAPVDPKAEKALAEADDDLPF